jgi:multidrug resistance efflux pump
MRGKWLLAWAAGVLLAAGAGALLYVRTQQPRGQERVEEVERPARPPAGELSLPATVRARDVVAVPVPVEGTIGELLAASGDQVYEGQLLARIRNTGLEAAQQAAQNELDRAVQRLDRLDGEVIALRLEASRARADATRAQMEFDRAERDFQRQQMLVREGATPRLVYERALREFEKAKGERDSLVELARSVEERLTGQNSTAEAARRAVEEKTQALEAAQEHFAAAEIHAPVGGLVIARTRQVGEQVDPDVHDLFQIATNLAALEAIAEPEPPARARIREGQEAFILIAGLPDAIPGRVRGIEGTQVIVEFTSPNPAILPGQSAQLRIKVE